MPRVVSSGIGYLRRDSVGLVLAVPGVATATAIVYEPETIAWIAAVEAAGGTFTSRSKTIANDLILALRAAGVIDKIVYFLPFLGANFAAGLVPLLDRRGVGPAGNTAFVEADFAEASGLQSNGSSKLLDSRLRPSELGTSNNGGMGWWELSVNFTGTASATMGYLFNPGSGTRGYYMGRYSSGNLFEWNQDSPGRAASDGITGANGHLYGQRSAANLRQLYFGGALRASSSISDPSDGANADTIRMFGVATNNVVPGPLYANARAGAAYLTDGTLTASEIANLHTALATKLIAPLGRA